MTTDTLRSSLALLTDAELCAMTRRAHAGAAAAWIALNRPLPNGPYSFEDGRTLRMIQLDEAQSLDDWWRELRAEAQRRAAR
jgi:hypothetical protein